mgnify:FL=1
METLYILLTIAAIVISILNTILFFKIWGMCNNITTIRKIMIENVIRQHYNPDKIIEEFREGDLVFDKKNKLYRIEEITDDGKLLCTCIKNQKEIVFDCKNVDKKLLQFVE